MQTCVPFSLLFILSSLEVLHVGIDEGVFGPGLGDIFEIVLLLKWCRVASLISHSGLLGGDAPGVQMYYKGPLETFGSVDA